MRVLSPNGNANESYTLSLSIDRGAGTVEVGSWGTAPIISKPDDDTLVLMARPGTVEGPMSGSINRVTGMTSINIITSFDRLWSFRGRCRTAQRLF